MVKTVRTIVKIRDGEIIPELRKYGKILDRFTLINAVGMDIKEKDIPKIRGLKGVEEVRLAGIAKAL